jgi:hypothetical protein
MKPTLTGLSLTSGLWLASSVWAINTQLGQMLPPAECIGHRTAAMVSFGASLVAILAASWSGWSAIAARGPLTQNFVGYVSAMVGLILSFALALQGLASLVLSGCDR